jgi:hypothetical protein
MSREPICIRRIFQLRTMRSEMLWEISRRFHRLCPGCRQVAHVLRTLPPVAARVLLPRAAPRLACVRPAASVHPEPGSNSSLYILYTSSLTPTSYSLFFIKKSTLSILCFSVLACTYLSVLSMNLSLPLGKGLQRYTTFLFLPNFFELFALYLFSDTKIFEYGQLQTDPTSL